MRGSGKVRGGPAPPLEMMPGEDAASANQSALKPVAGVVLAGGRSRRMGADKSSLILDGRRLLDIAQDLLGQAGCGEVFVSGRDDLPNGIADNHSRGGPARAMLTCLGHLDDRFAGALFIPVDMPRLDPVHLASLAAGPADRSRAWRGHPLPAYIPARAPRSDPAKIESVRDLLAAYRVAWLDPPDAGAQHFVNLNTREDWRAAQQQR